MNKLLKTTMATAALGLAMLNPAYADQQRHSHSHSHQQQGITLKQAVRRVKKRNPRLRVLKAYTHRSNAQTIHFVKVMTPKGRVRNITFNGRTGRRR